MADHEFKLEGEIKSIVPSDDKRWIIGATIRESLGTITEMTVEFVVRNGFAMDKLIGKDLTVLTKTAAGLERRFGGFVVALESVGQRTMDDGTDVHYVATVRPWLWMLTRATDNRIFQDKTVVDIIEEVFSDHGFTDFSKSLTETYETRNYCVQYRETDFDFISRLMEEEGIYYYFDNAPGVGAPAKMVLCDNTGAHSDTPGIEEMEYTGTGGRGIGGKASSITDFTSAERVITGKVTLNDFDMLTPKADLKVVEQTTTSSKHSHKSYENYHYPGKYRKDTGRGKRLAKVVMQSKEVEFQTYRGATTSRAVSTGYKVKVKDEISAQSGSVNLMITEAVHYIRPSISQRLDVGQLDRNRPELQYPDELEAADYVCQFAGIEKSFQFRSLQMTPWPEIAGLHTATVVGKAGEEIWTDEHGRVRVHFHWEREGPKNEKSTCWIRVATPWSGKDWGLVAIPRMGQEVVIQFEEGDPDRPICTGMMWNNETKPAFKYPDDATQLDIRTRSSKGGGAQDYNELMFEDKKGSEFMRVQAQKDHQFLIKNKSVLTIGQDEIDAGAHDDEGSLSEVIRNHVTRTIQEGNHYHTIQEGDEEFKIETGSQTIEIEKDKTQTVKSGNYDTTVSKGNMSVGVDMGKITIEAKQSIELKVGSNSVKIDQMGVTVKGMMVNIEGKTMAEMKSKMTTVKGDAMLTLKGGVTMIN